MNALAAHLKRSRIILETIDSEHPDARLHWRGADLGTWRDAAVRWVVSASGINLRFRAQAKTCTRRISSVRPAPWGATVMTDRVGRGNHEEILVVWRKEPSRRAHLGLETAMQGWLREKLPRCRIIQSVRRAELSRSLSGDFLRIHAKQAGSDHILVAGGTDPQSILTQAILWLECLRSNRRLKGIPRLWLHVPKGHSEVVRHRCRHLDTSRLKADVWEYEERPQGPWHISRAPVPSFPSENKDFRWPVLGPFRWSPLLAKALDLAPHSIQRYPRFHDYDSLRILGLEFARAEGTERDRVCFGIGDAREELNESNFAAFEALVNEILYFRRPDGPDPRHPLYRMQAERWLECLILNDAARLFPELAPESIYPQIPVYLGKIPGRVDILAVDREGTLVVMELKISEDPDLPLQALDYWGRVVRHNLSGDFERRGYFSGIRLNRNPPKIYLVSPVFSFHDSTETVLGFVDRKLSLSKIGINVDWRSGVTVMLRRRLGRR